MMIHAIVGIYAKIENFKSISTQAYIQNLLLGKAGACSQDRKFLEDNLSCNILDKSFQQIVKKEERE
jgi:hypothetical protein